MKDFSEFYERIGLIKNEFVNLQEQYSKIGDTHKAGWCYSCTLITSFIVEICGIYLQGHVQHKNLLKILSILIADNEQEQNKKDKMSFDAQKNMSDTQKRLIQDLRDYQTILRMYNSSKDIIITSNKLISLIDETIAYLQYDMIH